METIGAWAGVSALSSSVSQSPTPTDIVDQRIKAIRQNMRDTSDFILGNFWFFSTDTCNELLKASGAELRTDPTDFVLPTISVLCEKCDNVLPHNSGFRGQKEEFQTVSFNITKVEKQVPFQTFVFPYQCQGCKEEPLIFLVHREGIKLKLAGRNHFEKVQVPNTIPKQERGYFSDAIIAYNTGNVLAGLFLLRTTIEQYMRRILKVTVKIDGEKLAAKYATLLDPKFPQKYSTMKVIYEELSIVLHNADANSVQFDKSIQDIVGHFELLKHYPLKEQQQEQEKSI